MRGRIALQLRKLSRVKALRGCCSVRCPQRMGERSEMAVQPPLRTAGATALNARFGSAARPRVAFCTRESSERSIDATTYGVVIAA